eukprot:3559767-Pleurochrysis_carterae.AAC.1
MYDFVSMRESASEIARLVVGNFSAGRSELSIDAEIPLRAFEVRAHLTKLNLTQPFSSLHTISHASQCMLHSEAAQVSVASDLKPPAQGGAISRRCWCVLAVACASLGLCAAQRDCAEVAHDASAHGRFKAAVPRSGACRRQGTRMHATRFVPEGYFCG